MLLPGSTVTLLVVLVEVTVEVPETTQGEAAKPATAEDVPVLLWDAEVAEPQGTATWGVLLLLPPPQPRLITRAKLAKPKNSNLA